MPYRCSVVVPVFNDHTALISCMNALAGQSFPADSWEVIVVDNGSTPAIDLPDFDSINVRLIREDTPGAYAARNTAIHLSESGIVALTDADCLPDNDWLRRGLSAIDQTNGMSIVGGPVEMYLPPGDPCTAAALYDLYFGLRQEKYWRTSNFFVTANMFIPAAIFHKVGLFRDDLFSAADAEWCWRAIKNGYSLSYEPHALVRHPVRADWRDLKYKVQRDAHGHVGLRQSEFVRKARREKWAIFEKSRLLMAIIRGDLVSDARAKGRLISMAVLVAVWKRMAKIRFMITGHRNR